MGRGEQPVETGEIAEDRLDTAIVRHVVAEVGHRRGEDGREPDRVDPERGDIVEPARDAGEIADAVAVAILKGARVDLVNDPAFPPGNDAIGSCHSITARKDRLITNHRPMGSIYTLRRWRA